MKEKLVFQRKQASFLKEKTSCKTVGIDPAYPAVKVARKRGIETIHEFFLPNLVVLVSRK